MCTVAQDRAASASRSTSASQDRPVLGQGALPALRLGQPAPHPGPGGRRGHGRRAASRAPSCPSPATMPPVELQVVGAPVRPPTGSRPRLSSSSPSASSSASVTRSAAIAVAAGSRIRRTARNSSTVSSRWKSTTKLSASSSSVGLQAGHVGAVALADVQDADQRQRADRLPQRAAGQAELGGQLGSPWAAGRRPERPRDDHRLDLLDGLVGHRHARPPSASAIASAITVAPGQVPAERTQSSATRRPSARACRPCPARQARSVRSWPGLTADTAPAQAGSRPDQRARRR